MSDEAVKLCVDCAHFRSKRIGTDECSRTAPQTVINLVSGAAEMPKRYCFIERGMGDCGRAAKYWEPKGDAR